MADRHLHDIAAKEARNELTDKTIYQRLAAVERQKGLPELFMQLAEMEEGHYRFWKHYCGEAQVRADRLKVGWVMLIRKLLGPSFVIKYLESTEKSTKRHYEKLKRIIPAKDMKAFEAMQADETEHERAFAERIEGGHVRYMSFIVLGLADALVEIAGIHAGSLGIYSSTELTGLAGIVAGAAASLSMASAAYAQAKQGFKGSAGRAAVYTGISYFVSAVIMALPYFLTQSPNIAIVTSLIFGIVIIGFVSWYNSVLSASNLRKDFAELAGVMLAATVALFALGLAIRYVFGITI